MSGSTSSAKISPSGFLKPEAPSPYLKPARLPDIIAAIQAMAVYDEYKMNCEEWSEQITDNKCRSKYWQTVFDEHPEFFRRTKDGGYSLILRRAFPRRYHRKLRKLISEEEYAKLSDKDKDEYISRQPLDTEQMKLLLDSAVIMHAKALEVTRDWRWWFAPGAAFVASFLTAVFAFIAAWQFRK